MSNTVLHIFNQFNRHPVTDSYADYSRIGHIGISSSQDAYRLTAYPGWSIMGLNIDITVQGGIFGSSAPTKVETSPVFGAGMVVLESPPETPGENKGTMARPPATETLLLPDDEDFALFTDLHSQVSALKPGFAEAVATTGIDIDPHSLQLQERTGVQLREPISGGTRHCRDIKYKITDANGTTFKAELDASVVVPGGIRVRGQAPDGIMPGTLPTFRKGTYFLDGRTLRRPSFESLLAFGALQATIEKLYT